MKNDSPKKIFDAYKVVLSLTKYVLIIHECFAEAKINKWCELLKFLVLFSVNLQTSFMPLYISP